MDQARCQALKERLADQPQPPIVALDEFFDGNDDMGSIGCNLSPHPGINVFRDVLTGLLARPNVQAVYAQIAELDPGEESWPFADTILVEGQLSADELRTAVSALQPDEVGNMEHFDMASPMVKRLGSRVLVVWWD